MARYQFFANPRSAPSYKVGLMFALSGVPFDFHYLDFARGDLTTPEHTARNRFQQMPVVTDTSDNRTVVQSAVILEFLADRFDRFGGKDRWERIEIREWMFWAADRLNPPLWRSRANRLGFRPMSFDIAAMYVNEGKAALGALERHLAGRDWIVGEEPTIADIDIYCPVSVASVGGFDLGALPLVAAFKARFEALPGFRPQKDLLPAKTTLSV
jgi:glutathione S-transferase